MAYRRNRRNWRRGGRDTFPLRVAGVLAGMMLVLLGTAVWAVFGGRAEPARVATPEGTEERAEQTAALPAADAESADPSAVTSGPPAATGPADAGETAEAEEPPPAATRSVVTPVAAPAPRLRPRAPADTTAAGHAGLAEALLAAGDTAGAIVAYNAFLARNTDPAQERAAIAKLREIGVSWRARRRDGS